MKRIDLPDGMWFRWKCEHSNNGGRAGDRTDGPSQLECEVEITQPQQVAAHAIAILISAVSGVPLEPDSWWPLDERSRWHQEWSR